MAFHPRDAFAPADPKVAAPSCNTVRTGNFPCRSLCRSENRAEYAPPCSGFRSTRFAAPDDRHLMVGSTKMPSRLTAAEVERIARLAHLDLTSEEQERFTRQLGQILDYAARLQDVDTTDVPAAWLPGAAADALRPDVAGESLSNTAALRNAPAPGPTGLFRVPKVIG